MEKKNIDWSNLGFGYVPTDKRFVANFKNGSWDEGALTEDSNIVMSEYNRRRTYCYLSPGPECIPFRRFCKAS